MEILCHLLPDLASLKLKRWLLDEAKTHIKLSVSSTQTVVHCPICTHPTHRIHSHYERTLADLPWADYTITLEFQVRKFFCLNKQCFRRIFTERIATVAAPWARRTQRMAKQLTAIGLALGGAAGERLSQQLGCAVSRNTILQLVSRLPLPPIVIPKTLGVDDFSFRKRETYGTVLIDLERSRPIALLGDPLLGAALRYRETESLAAWLEKHPGVQVVSRDRSKAYKAGITQGAPLAIQVADRFHLLQNLVETLDQVFNTHGKDLKAVEAAHSLSSTTSSDWYSRCPHRVTVFNRAGATENPTATDAAIVNLSASLESTSSGRALPQQSRVNSASVKRVFFAISAHPAFLNVKGVATVVEVCFLRIKNIFSSDGTKAVTIPKDCLRQYTHRGYSGSYDTVARYTRRLRSAQGLPLRQRLVRQPLPKVAQPEKRPLTAPKSCDACATAARVTEVR